MKRHAYTLTLLDDTIISRSAATLGGHQSLDYIPGQTLLGACAATLYGKSGADSYTLFHSGKLRFGNALPLVGKQPAHPVPMCWHENKAAPALEDAQPDETHPDAVRLDGSKIWNLSRHGALPDAAQPKQLRNGYLDACGHVHKPRLTLRMKTAINPADRRAANGQLFGYQAIPRGSRFGGWIEADDELPDTLFKQAINALRGDLLIGRSRSAEYGRARFSDADFSPPAQGRCPPDSRQASVWLLSDLALQDQHGQPTLQPLPEYLGLPPGEVVWSRSFIRSRRYSPWNGKRGAPDLERNVIRQGSIIQLRFNQPPGDSLAARCAGGLGLHREAGLGRVWLNPPLLDTDQPQFAPAPPAAPDRANTPPRPKSALIDWLHTRQQQAEQRGAVDQQADELFKQFEQVLGWAASLQGLQPDADFGPSAQQWGRIDESARNHAPATLVAHLFDGDNAIVKPTAEGWKQHYRDQDGQRRTLAWWLEHALRDIDSRQLTRVTQQFAHRCRDAQARRGGLR